MPIIQLPPTPPKKVTIAVRLEEPKLAELRRYGTYLGTKNVSTVVSQGMDIIYDMDTEYHAWRELHPHIVAEKKSRHSAATKQHAKVHLSGAPAPSAVAAAEAAS